MRPRPHDARRIAAAAFVLLAATEAALRAGGGGPAAEPAGGAAAAIAAAHRKIDEELRAARLSPFTAVAAHYVEAGRTATIGAGREGALLDPASPMPAMASVTYDGGAFWIAPAHGAGAPRIHGTAENGDVAAGDGVPVAERRRLDDGEVAGLGRFFLEMSPQSGMGRILIYDPESPMKKSFTGLRWFDPNPALQVKAAFRPDPEPAAVVVGTSRGLEKEFFRAGTFEFTVDGADLKLIALAGRPRPAPGDHLFVPFRDATTGRETYEVGRYLDVEYAGPDADYVIDFNRATNPNCNYSPHYNCPIPPRENTLSVPIRAGERTYPAHPAAP